MKLYYAPGACSLADHIAMLEADMDFEVEAVDIHTKRTASGRDFHEINPKGYVPALVLDNGETLTENTAVLDWIAGEHPRLAPNGTLSRTRQIEMLSFLSTEIYRSFKPLWHGGSDEEKAEARQTVAELLQFTAAHMRGDYLFGDNLSAADCFLYVMLRWADRFGIAVPELLTDLRRRMEARETVQRALWVEDSGQHTQHIDRQVRENAEHHRFERPIHDAAIAAAYYRLADGKTVFTHTEVPSEFSGVGIGTDLARGTFELLRASGRKAVLACPFMVHFWITHPEYGDVVEG